jgi:hypothetical protein
MGSYKVSLGFIDRSNKKKSKVYGYCLKHDTTLGRDQFGNPYKRCFYGHKLQDICEIQIRKVGDKNDR